MSDSLPTPYILIDAAVVRRNVEQMALYAREHGLNLRPHTKTHKSLHVGKLQLDQGAAGLTVAKPGEAEVMADISDDLLLAYPAVDASRCEMLAKLAQEKTIRVGIDSTFAAGHLASAARSAASTIGILVDLDVGHHRTGVQSAADALALAQVIDQTPGLRLDGLMFFPGHIAMAPDQQRSALETLSERLDEVIDLWRKSGLEASIVSGGSTPTAHQSHHVRHLTEIRPGTYVYNDMNSVHSHIVPLEACAARVIASVVSTAVPGQVVLDSGTKTLTSDRCGPAPDSGHGYVFEFPEAKITKLFEEHAQVDIRACSRAPRLGERVTIIPNHICPCINLQDNIWWKEPDRPATSLAVDARGKVF